MKRIISIILTVCFLLSAFPLTASAVPAPEPPLPIKQVYFADYNQFKDAYLFCWDYFVSPPYEWPGIKMDVIEEDGDGNVVYSAVLPEDTNSYIISNGTTMQTVDISYQYRDLITLTGDLNEDYHYIVDQTSITDGTVPKLSGDEPQPTTKVEENLIVFDNTENGFDNNNLTICCRTGINEYGEESTVHAKMEPYDMNDFAEQMFRFAMPEGMKYYYLTDGKKRSQECVFSGSVHLFASDDKDDDGNTLLYDVGWCGGIDPVFTKGASHTLFDRFCEEYVVPDDGGFDDSFTDLYQLYDEMSEHHDSKGKIDWVLVHAASFIQLTVYYSELIGNRVVTRACEGAPFPSGYGIYDVKQDRFIPLNGKTAEEYDGLKATFDKRGEGKLLGDTDGDNTITVLDATVIQRCVALITDYPEEDELLAPIGSIRYYSDFNRDGNRNILDTTAIQRYLVGI